MKICPKCKHTTPVDAVNFCYRDGTKLVIYENSCANCGVRFNPNTDLYCENCGKQLEKVNAD